MEEYVIRAKSGDKEAFTLIFLGLKEDLYKIAKSRLKNESDVNDVIQNTIMIAYKNIRSLRNNATIKSWIIKILVNECNKIYKDTAKNNVISIEEWNCTEENCYFDIENNDGLSYLLSKLNYKEKVIMNLYYKDKYTSKEIAYMLHTNNNTIKSIIKRAKSKIKKMLKEEEECQTSLMK